MLEIRQLAKRFGKHEILKGIDYQIEQPGTYAILGPNGSGKTTLLKCILGMTIPDTGVINFMGTNIQKEWGYRSAIGYLPQIARFPDNLRVLELIKMIRDLRANDDKADELVQKFELDRHLNKRLGNLSGGTRQKVNIVLTFMFDNPLYILDEPTAGLDPVSLIRLKEMIRSERSKGKTFLLTTHIIDLVEELADEIIFLLEGRVYFRGSIGELEKRTSQKDLEHAIAEILNAHD